MKKSYLKRLIKEIILESTFKPLPREARPYKCTVCGAVQSITTNHDGPVIEYCPKCSHSPSRGQSYDIPGRHKHCRAFVYDPSVNEVSQFDINQTHPKRVSFDSQWNPKLKMMTLYNLKSMIAKTRRMIDSMKNSPHLRRDRDGLQKELQLHKLYSDEIKRRLQYINNPMDESQGIFKNQVSDQSQCTGYSHGVSSDYNDVQLVRDPLNDPRLNNKLDEENKQYRFDDKFFEKGRWDNREMDVYYGTILLGTLWSRPDGYIVDTVMGIKHSIKINRTSKNKFKTKEEAAKALHVTWKSLRYHD